MSRVSYGVYLDLKEQRSSISRLVLGHKKAYLKSMRRRMFTAMMPLSPRHCNVHAFFEYGSR